MGLLLCGLGVFPSFMIESRLVNAQIEASGQVATVYFYASLDGGRLELLGVEPRWREEPWQGPGDLVRFRGSLEAREAVVFDRWPLGMVDEEARTEVLCFATQEIERVAELPGGTHPREVEWPADLSEQLEAMMPAALEAWASREQRFRWRSFEVEERPDLDRAAVLPVHVGALTPSASGMRPGFSHDAPARWKLWAVLLLRWGAYVLQPIGFVCLFVNVYRIIRHERWKQLGACLSCGYDLQGLRVCPECGQSVAPGSLGE